MSDQQYEQFIQHFAANESSLRAFCRSMLPRRQDVDEVIQNTSLVLWKKFETFEPGSSFFKWAAVIARFEVLKHRRAMARDRHVFSEPLLELLADGAIERTERTEAEKEALGVCLEQMPDDRRELVTVAYGHGVTIADAASRVGRTPTAMYKALNRIRRSLLQCIESRLQSGVDT